MPPPTAESPRLQDILDPDVPFVVTLHDGFDFWVGDAELDDEGRSSLERANESVVPTERIEGATSVYWCVINERSYVRWVLPYDEDTATAALARLHAAGRDRLTPDTRLLGAFRAGGLLVPVWEVPGGREGGRPHRRRRGDGDRHRGGRRRHRPAHGRGTPREGRSAQPPGHPALTRGGRPGDTTGRPPGSRLP